MFIINGYKIKETDNKFKLFSIIENENNNDYLEQLVNFNFIIPNNKNKYIEFRGLFKNDYINIFIKTSQISNKFLYNMKKNFYDKIDEDTTINIKFKNYMKYTIE